MARMRRGDFGCSKTVDGGSDPQGLIPARGLGKDAGIADSAAIGLLVCAVGELSMVRSAAGLMFAMCCAMAGLVPAEAQAGKRVALVIGNAEYAVGPLANPLRDA